MVRNDIINSSLLKTKFLIYAFNGRTTFCPLFSTNFNIVSAFLSTNLQPGRKKSILAKVCLDAKRGQHAMLAK